MMDIKQLAGAALLLCAAVIILGMIVSVTGWRVALGIVGASCLLSAMVVCGIMLLNGVL